ncbi:MAG: serine protease [Actinomycetota bacterium]
MRRRLALVLITAIAVAACSDDGDDALSGAEVLARVEPTVAFVSTGLGSGSGVLVDGGYVVTNVHVVDPYPVVNLVFPDGTELDEVPVAASDPGLDLALLGPVDLDVEPIEVGAATDLARADRVYLIGFPGETEVDPVATISEGIVSRFRDPDDWPDVVFVQSDTAIGGGQSGGALVDDAGRLVGISGYSFAESFALSIDAEQVTQLIADADGDRAGARWFAPDAADTQVTTVELVDSRTFVSLWFEPGDGVVELSVEGARDPIVIAGDPAGYHQVTAAGTTLLDLTGGLGADSFDDRLSGSPYELLLDPLAPLEVVIGSGQSSAVDLRIRADVPFAISDTTAEPIELEVGERVETIVEGWERFDRFVVLLEEGEEYEVLADGPIADPLITILAPGEEVADGVQFDDDATGLFGLDASGTYTAKRTGKHEILVSAWDVEAVGVALEIVPAE